MLLRRQQQPHWLWRHKRSETKLHMILQSLQGSTEDQITAEKAQHCGMQLNPLDFETGDTSPFVSPCFAPRDDDSLLIRKTRFQLQKSNFFRCCLGTGAKYQNKSPRQRNNLLRSALVETFKDYRNIANRSRNIVADLHHYEFDSHSIYSDDEFGPNLTMNTDRDDGSLDRAIHHNGKQANLRVVTSHELRSENHRMRHNHQIITISINERPGALPSITELQVLATQTRQAMRFERKLGQFNNPRNRHSQPRMVKYEFPTLVTTIYRRGYVRVIYGYMDGTLKIQYTEPQQITVDNFESMMKKLLQWNLPETQGDPTKVVTLPTIQEEEEDPTVQVTQISKTAQLTKQEITQINNFLQRCLEPRSSLTNPWLYKSLSRNINHNNVRSKYTFYNWAYNPCALPSPIACKKIVCKKPQSPKPKPIKRFWALDSGDHVLTSFG
ncbi:hypothetical protein N7448_001002 [Penicillium atrosanguineum]|nr:hypothetical protein N7448_001002 [Penicillium atrosanguineum]